MQIALKQQFDNCSIKKFDVLAPIKDAGNQHYVFLPKVKTVLQIFTVQEYCVFLDETIDIIYQKGGKESLLIRELIDANKQVTFFLNFEGKENNIASIKIGDSSSLKIKYTYHPGIKLDTSENAKKTKLNFDPKVVKKDFEKTITELFLEAKLQVVPTASWKKLLDLNSIHQIIEKDQVEELPDLTSVSDETLSAFNSGYGLRRTPFFTLLEKLDRALQIFKGLPANYNGSDAAKIFDRKYELAIDQSSALVIALEEKVMEYTLIIDAVAREQNLRQIPANIRTFYQQALQILKQQTPIVTELKKRIDTYPSLDLEYAAWKIEVETSSNAIKESIEALSTALNPLVSTVEGLKDENQQTWIYKNWKKDDFSELTKKYELVQYDANKLLEHDALKNKIKVLASNDGFLEFTDSKSENNFSEAEKRHFKKNIADSYQLRHETPLDEEGEELPPFKDGPQIEDIEQGQVSDCYLLAAMANLANGDTANLLEEMIEEKEVQGKKIYVVTLYQEGIPIQVEVDAKFMTLTAPEEEDFKNPKKHLGAVPKKDIWVPIIEKAYAKLMAKGDYTLIENNTPQNAMKVLLGNKLKLPNSFLLDKEGKLTQKQDGEGTYIQNPIPLASTSLQQLQQVLEAAQEKGYKMNLTSPKTYRGAKGLNHNHVLDIGNGNYMSFEHVYTITGIDGNMVAVFNPHGKAAQLKTFLDKDLHQLMQELKRIKEQFEREYETESFSNSSKEVMIALAQQLNTSSFNADFRKIINSLESIHKEGLKEKKELGSLQRKSMRSSFLI